MTVQRFFAYAEERQRIYERRHVEGRPKPWTDDPILRRYSFTEIYRERDATTIWFRENIRHPMAIDRSLPKWAPIFATIAFRWFNLIKTGGLLSEYGSFKRWNEESVVDLLGRHLPPYVSGAYIINSARFPGVPKHVAIATQITEVWKRREELTAIRSMTMEDATSWLAENIDGMGRFMAYEVVCDLRWENLVDHHRDKMTWANPGPGARRGLERVFGSYNIGNEESQVLLMREILNEAAGYGWSAGTKMRPRWEMREVEHTLCEFDKYERTRLGEGRPKKRFNGESE